MRAFTVACAGLDREALARCADRLIFAPAAAGIDARKVVDTGVLPVINSGIAVEDLGSGRLRGVEAVIDKDRASALLAIELDADLLLIPTGVERVAIRFGTPDQPWLGRISAGEARRYAAEGHFGEGSMAPKIEALLTFVAGRPGGRGIITNAESIERALRGETETSIEG